MATPSLATPRLLLRSLTLEHLPSLVCWEADAELRHLNDEDPDPAPAHEVEAIVRGWLAPGRVDLLPFAIHLRSDDRCVGWCMLAAIDPAAGECRIGFTLGERELWRVEAARSRDAAGVFDLSFDWEAGSWQLVACAD